MIHFAAYETFLASFVMLIFGALFVVFNILLTLTLKSIRFVFESRKLKYIKQSVFSKNEYYFKAEFKNRLIIFALDFINIIVFSILFILLSYSFYDGILRIYFLGIAVGSYIFFKKLAGDKISSLMEKIICSILTCFIIFLRTIAKPLKALYRLLSNLLLILFTPIRKRIEICRSDRIFNTKIREIDAFLLKIPKKDNTYY